VRKGIILAGGSGTRLYPITEAISKQMVPVFDKPMIYYPLSVLMLAGIREIAIISSPQHLPLYRTFLGNGSKFGLKFEYIEQKSPDGLAQAYILCERFLDGHASVLALGDNIFFGHSLTNMLIDAAHNLEFSTIFCSQVPDPERFGIIELEKHSKIVSVEEKPKLPKSNYAITGLYFLGPEASRICHSIKPSPRGELEIIDVLKYYLSQNKLRAKLMKRGFAWFDTGTHRSLLNAANFVETVQTQQGLMIACLEEIAFNNGWISQSELEKSASIYEKSDYGRYLKNLLN